MSYSKKIMELFDEKEGPLDSRTKLFLKMAEARARMAELERCDLNLQNRIIDIQQERSVLSEKIDAVRQELDGMLKEVRGERA